MVGRGPAALSPHTARRVMAPPLDAPRDLRPVVEPPRRPRRLMSSPRRPRGPLGPPWSGQRLWPPAQQSARRCCHPPEAATSPGARRLRHDQHADSCARARAATQGEGTATRPPAAPGVRCPGLPRRDGRVAVAPCDPTQPLRTRCGVRPPRGRSTPTPGGSWVGQTPPAG